MVVVASTGRGVCAVRIGQDPEPLIARLREEFPLADLERDDGSLQSVASILEDALRGSGDATSLPLDVQGTAFQIRVWEALRRIERGTTQTYSEVAATIGSPSAVRAVASACAANPAALTIPCHRVVRKDGSLGGYRWGLATKRALLDAESSGSPA